MNDLYTHSEQVGKDVVRYLRRDEHQKVGYRVTMRLRIKELRQERGWTVEHLADIVHLSKSYVSEIENGKKQANQSRIKRFADAFGVKVYDLLDQDTLGPAERELLNAYAGMDDDGRRTLLSVAASLKK